MSRSVASPSPGPAPWKAGLVLAAGVCAVSTGAIFTRLAMGAADQRGLGFSLVLAVARLGTTAAILLPAWRNLGRSPRQTGALPYTIAAGLCLALHFATWIASLSYTSIAASVTLVTTNPVWVSLLAWVWWGDRPTRQTAAGIAIALAGGLLVGLGGAAGGAGSQPLLGNALALVGAWTISLYFLLGREAQQRGMPLGSYGAIAYGTAALVLLPLPWLAGARYGGHPLAAYGYMLGMALVSQLVGHTSFNWAVARMSPTLVTLAILFEPVGSSLLGYWIFGEVPGRWVFVGAAVLLAGVAIAVAGSQPKPPEGRRSGAKSGDRPPDGP